MSCIVNAAAENISRLSEDYNIYHEAWDNGTMQLQWYNQDAGHLGCHEFSRQDASLPHPMLDTCCNNWQSVINQKSRGSLAHTDGIVGVPTETLDIMLVEYFQLTNKPKEVVPWPKGTQKILPIGQ